MFSHFDRMNFDKRIFLVALVVYLITAYYSVGYFQADEHYQIIEFAGLLDGTNGPEDLTWEYSTKIRSSLQPVLAYAILQGCESLSVPDPYTKALILRVLTALVSLSIIYYFTRSRKKLVPSTYWKLFLTLSYFLWFLPFINVRFSSETWSGLFLLLSVGLAMRDRISNGGYAIIGITMGLSVLFRYQIAFAYFGMLAWFLYSEKSSLGQLLLNLSSFAGILFIGVLIDSWFYGEWTLALFNNFQANIIEGKAAEYGSTPWYFYLFLVFRYTFFPIGTFILLSLITTVITRPKSLYVWVIIPFLVGHSLIDHKELRFLFPLVNLLPILIIWLMQTVLRSVGNATGRIVVGSFFGFIFIINIVALPIASMKPAGAGRVAITEQIHDLNTKKRAVVLHTSGNNPYSPWGLTTNFYREPNAEFHDMGSTPGDQLNPLGNDANVFLVIRASEVNDTTTRTLIQELNLHEIGKSVPGFTLPFLQLYGYRMGDIILLYGEGS